jgi:Tetratricopeptide repeat/Bacterial SH3 domain
VNPRSWILALAVAVALARATAPSVGHAAAGTAPPESLFVAGNAAFERGDYAEAIDSYVALTERGIVNPSLDFNLGNAYFKAGDLGHAVLHYERARRLDPRNDDVRENLALVRTLVRDKQLVSEPTGLRRVSTVWHRDTTVAESVAIASGLYVLLCALAVMMVFRRTPWVSRAYRRVSVLSPARLFGLDMTQDLAIAMSLVFALTAVFTASAVVKLQGERGRVRGVVVVAEVPVFSGPSRDATVQFKVHEGTVLTVRDARSDWVQIDLPGDLSGWMDARSVERI